MWIMFYYNMKKYFLMLMYELWDVFYVECKWCISMKYLLFYKWNKNF